MLTVPQGGAVGGDGVVVGGVPDEDEFAPWEGVKDTAEGCFAGGEGLGEVGEVHGAGGEGAGGVVGVDEIHVEGGELLWGCGEVVEVVGSGYGAIVGGAGGGGGGRGGGRPEAEDIGHGEPGAVWAGDGIFEGLGGFPDAGFAEDVVNVGEDCDSF